MRRHDLSKIRYSTKRSMNIATPKPIFMDHFVKYLIILCNSFREIQPNFNINKYALQVKM